MIFFRLVVRRMIASAFLVACVVSVSWVLTASAPGGRAGVGPGGFLIEEAQAAPSPETRVGLASWWRRASRLDFGYSTRYQRPAWPLVTRRALNSALLSGCALAVALALGLPMGLVSGAGRGWLPQAIRSCSVLLLSCPPLVLAMILTWLAVRNGWAVGNAHAEPGGALLGRQTLRALVLPTLALAVPLAATLERLQSRALERVMEEPWLTALGARGLGALATWRHAWWAALPPVASVGGLVAGSLLSGAVAVEVITAWPGLGRLTFDALVARDTALVAGCAAMTSLLVSAAALVSDLLVAWADPRARIRA
jgi:ABC-type dipeptide/oligopeptide/nickel transport system permease component